ncbi:response regulator transcription factor [Arthrobacter polaris]|uniref:response regulator transcription factor n=1 Tax=Arthrobacter polaris TaxID=2813727 RepID=UPI003D7D6D1D
MRTLLNGARKFTRVPKNLTRRESEIALMAARGIPDKDIAHQLHVSVRTVEGHLYRAYSKLGITARNQLSTVALIRIRTIGPAVGSLMVFAGATRSGTWFVSWPHLPKAGIPAGEGPGPYLKYR